MLGPLDLVGSAAERFTAGDDTGFVACFHDGITVYNEPELSPAPLVHGRAALAQMVARARRDHAELAVRVLSLCEAGDGTVAETVIVATDDAWRLALAVCCTDGLITEVRAFRDVEAATSWLTGLP